LKINLITSECWIVGLTGLILSCSLINLHFQNHYSTYLITIIILLLLKLRYKNKHQTKKLFLFGVFFSICTTLISNNGNCSTNLNIPLNQIDKKEYHFKVVNILEKRIESVNYLKGDIVNTEPILNLFFNKSLFIKNKFSLNLNEYKQINIVTNIENIKLDTKNVWIDKANLLINNANNNKTFLRNLENKLFNNKYHQSMAFGWAMLTGIKKFINPTNLRNHKMSGTMHYFAVSGLHIGFLYLILNFLLKRLLMNDNLVLFITFSICLIYIYILNFPISAVRSLLMISIFYFCKNALLNCKKITFFCMTLISVIIYDHQSIFSLSAQLSFIVVLFILFSIYSVNFRKKETLTFWDKLKSILIISLAASAGSALLIIDAFQTFPYLSIIANLIFAPFIFVFYIINIAHISCLTIFDSNYLSFIHELLYNIFSNTTKIVSTLNNFLPDTLSSSLSISPLVHYFLFASFLLSFCFRISTNIRLPIISAYYAFIWFSYYFLCN
jgi:ComEC/Rec2-related protein